MPTPLTAFIMRHARAASPRPGERDFDRPLVASGLADAAAMGRWLHAQVPALSMLLSSPALRARMTADAMLAAWGASPPRVEWASTLYLAELPVLLETLEFAGTGPILLLGHNPGLAELVEYLVPDAAERAHADSLMPTAAFYAIDVGIGAAGIRRGSGTLRGHMRPARLPPDS